jgi:hypothetical protein
MREARYDEDFYQWSQDTAQALLEGRLAGLDIEHIAEEIRDLGISQKTEIANRFAQIMTHLLKMKYQPEKRTRSWDHTIAVQRLEIRSVLENNPSLARPEVLAELIQRTYRKAASRAALDTELPRDSFPKQCPFTLEDVLPAGEPD